MTGKVNNNEDTKKTCYEMDQHQEIYSAVTESEIRIMNNGTGELEQGER